MEITMQASMSPEVYRAWQRQQQDRKTGRFTTPYSAGVLPKKVDALGATIPEAMQAKAWPADIEAARIKQAELRAINEKTRAAMQTRRKNIEAQYRPNRTVDMSPMTAYERAMEYKRRATAAGITGVPIGQPHVAQAMLGGIVRGEIHKGPRTPDGVAQGQTRPNGSEARGNPEPKLYLRIPREENTP